MDETIKFKRRSNADHELLVSSGYFFRINEDACRCLGASVYELAQTDPVKAYQYLRRAIATTAFEAGLDVSRDGMIVADASLEETDYVRSVAEDTMLAMMPPEYEGPFDVSVGILPGTETDGADLAQPDGPMNVLRLQVRPDSLAA